MGSLEHSDGRHATKGGPGLGVGLAHDTGPVMSTEPVERDAAPLGQELPRLRQCERELEPARPEEEREDAGRVAGPAHHGVHLAGACPPLLGKCRERGMGLPGQLAN